MLRWHLFCDVIDHFGDAGVALRLARRLALRHGDAVLLLCNRLDLLQRLAADEPLPGVELRAWPQDAHRHAALAAEAPDVLVECFGCSPPAAYLEGLARRAGTRPPWINLEYLSAEPYVRASHGLPSPQHDGPGKGLRKWFFFPGFEPGTGGVLLDEPLHEAAGTQPSALWFGYDDLAFAALLQAWRRGGFGERLKLAHGGVTDTMLARLRQAGVPHESLAFMSQRSFDRMLARSAWALVRGEDSFVQAQALARPFVWQAYRQSDRAHRLKVEAFLKLYCADVPNSMRGTLQRLYAAANGLEPQTTEQTASDWSAFFEQGADWLQHACRWCAHLREVGDLAANLRAFALARLA
jgi:hypothetical protein